LAIAAFAPALAFGGQEPLRLVSDPWPPFTAEAGDQRFAIALVHRALERAGYEVETTIVPSGTLAERLKGSEFAGSAAFWRSPERERVYRFSKPYLQNRLVLVGRKGTDVSASRLEEVGAKTVALVKDYAYGDAIESAPGPKFIRGPSDLANLKSLLAGEVDYVVADEVLIYHLFTEYPDDAGRLLAVGPTPVAVRSLHLAIRKDYENSQAIIQRFDAQLRPMLAEGEYNQVLDITWVRADVDGDGRPELVVDGERVGTAAPQSSYPVQASEEPEQESAPAGYVVGGKVYGSWEEIPDYYKKPPRKRLKSRRSGVELFSF
jgi:polar amino acid transport system substrate-binding protein